jgi:hypothetical protein
MPASHMARNMLCFPTRISALRRMNIFYHVFNTLHCRIGGALKLAGWR